ncbi:hypothetical protein Droror1_Dr00027610 [Drosera rotundifolia]
MRLLPHLHLSHHHQNINNSLEKTMRRSIVIGRLRPPIGFPAASFSTAGRGRGTGAATTSTSPNNPPADHPPPSPSFGRGRGKTVPSPSSPFLPSFNAPIKPPPPPTQNPPFGSAEGRAGPTGSPPESIPRRPIFFSREDSGGNPSGSDSAAKARNPSLAHGLVSVLSSAAGSGGAGRGMPMRGPPDQEVVVEEKKQENRHLNPRGEGRGGGVGVSRGGRLGRGGGVDEREDNGGRTRGGRGGGGRGGRWVMAEGVGEGGRGRRGRGRGRGGRWRGGGRDGGVREREWRDDDRVRGREDEDGESEDDLGWLDGPDDDVEAEKFAQKVGPDVMSKLQEVFDELEHRLFPHEEENYLDALDMNLKIELEPEYMVEFGNNPDIDEKPPISLEGALEKMKPFLMAYEGIENQQEWEEVVKETMERALLLKQIVDSYTGPDRVTAKEQQEELENVANALPANVPDSVKRFTDRALLSLQSNPGWGFNKKRQFVDKLVREVSDSYR